METSGSGLFFSFSIVALFVAAALCVGPLLEGRVSIRTVPLSGRILWLAVAVPSLLQIPFPGVYEALYRNASAVLDDHQWWRVATALIVQDGGITGTISSLTFLAIALLWCLPLWGSRWTVLTFIAMGTALNVAAVSLGAQDGGGESGATLVLLASLPPLSLALAGSGRIRPVLGLAITVGVASVLIAADDGHGYAVVAGLVLGIAGMPHARRRLRHGHMPR